MIAARMLMICIALLITCPEPSHSESPEILKICDVAQKIVNQVATSCSMDDKVERIDCALLFTRTGVATIGKDSLKDPEARSAWARISGALIDWAEKGCPRGEFDSVVKKNLIPPCEKLDLLPDK